MGSQWGDEALTEVGYMTVCCPHELPVSFQNAHLNTQASFCGDLQLGSDMTLFELEGALIKMLRTKSPTRKPQILVGYRFFQARCSAFHDQLNSDGFESSTLEHLGQLLADNESTTCGWMQSSSGFQNRHAHFNFPSKARTNDSIFCLKRMTWPRLRWRGVLKES